MKTGKNTRLACEDCDNAMECKKINPEGCKRYTLAVNSNFDMAREYRFETVTAIPKY